MSEQEAKEQKGKEEAEAKKPAPEAAAGGTEKKHIRKVSAMSLKEIDAKLKEIEEKMGGFQSGYARQLLAKKAELTGQKH